MLNRCFELGEHWRDKEATTLAVALGNLSVRSRDLNRWLIVYENSLRVSVIVVDGSGFNCELENGGFKSSVCFNVTGSEE